MNRFGQSGGAGFGGGQGLVDQTFFYSFNFGSLTTLATVTKVLTTQADANFLWQMTAFYGNLHGVTEPQAMPVSFPFTIAIVNSGPINNFIFGSDGSNVAPVSNIAGTGPFPLVLPEPQFIRAVSTISVTLTSLSANTWDNLSLTLIGKKTYQSAPLNGPAIG